MRAGTLLVVGLITGAFAGALIADARLNITGEVSTAVKVVVPRMERVGEVGIGHDKLRLWAFEFEGRQCLWGNNASGAHAGLTCDWMKED